MILSDPAAERAVLAGIFNFGNEAYFDIVDIINEDSFTIDSNKFIYACLKHILNKDTSIIPDIAGIYSASNELGLDNILNKKEEVAHLSAITKFPVDIRNVRRFAAKIRKLQISRLMYNQLELTKDKYLDIKGDEPLSHILGIAEESIFDFTSLLNETEDAPVPIFKDINERLEWLSNNIRDQVGISTGFPNYDFSIGGGLRQGTVNIVAARPKTGKTLLADNIGVHIARNIGIPVLNLDTEMRKTDHQDRLMAMLTEIGISEIETGKFSNSYDIKQRLFDTATEVKNVPYYYMSIGGKPFEDQLAIMRRWIFKNVGLNDEGKAKDCVIIYDYLKLMDTSDMKGDLKEYQLLGFLMTSLHNFALRYDIPFLAFVQLNRDGITKETTDTASGSDRIVWLCSNFSIYKRKSDEEIATDGPSNGNRKLVPVIARHGEGLNDGDYINMEMKGFCGKISEGKLHSEINNNPTDDFTDDEYDIPFD